MDIHHFDFYRLKDPGVCAFELAEVLGDPDKLVIVEWGGIVADILPVKRLSVEIEAAPTVAGVRSPAIRFPSSSRFAIFTQRFARSVSSVFIYCRFCRSPRRTMS